jgi:hypothetical protein
MIAHINDINDINDRYSLSLIQNSPVLKPYPQHDFKTDFSSFLEIADIKDICSRTYYSKHIKKVIDKGEYNNCDKFYGKYLFFYETDTEWPKCKSCSDSLYFFSVN